MDVCFKHVNFPSNALNEENIMAYFCDPLNPFYERSCDNENIKMQHVNINSTTSVQEMLLNQRGIQYVLTIASPPLFVICKHKRNSPNQVTPLCYYYILDGTIYQCPDIYSLVQSRLASALDPLVKSLNSTLDTLRFNAATGYNWEFKNRPAKISDENSTSDDEESTEPYTNTNNNMAALGSTVTTNPSTNKKELDESNPRNVRSTPYQRMRTEVLLRNLIAQFPPQADIVYERQNTTQKTNLQSQNNSSSNLMLQQQQQQNMLEKSAGGGISSNETYSSMFNLSSNVSLANAPTPPACGLIAGGGGASGGDGQMDENGKFGPQMANSTQNFGVSMGIPCSMPGGGGLSDGQNNSPMDMLEMSGPASMPAGEGAHAAVSIIGDSNRPASAFAHSSNNPRQQANKKIKK